MTQRGHWETRVRRKAYPTFERCLAAVLAGINGTLSGGEMGSLHHVAGQAKFEAKGSDESRNGIGSRWGVVAGGRRDRSGRWFAGRYSDGEHGSYSL
jgi:hypothetical protein